MANNATEEAALLPKMKSITPPEPKRVRLPRVNMAENPEEYSQAAEE